MVVVVVPTVNVLSVIVLEVYRGGKMNFVKILKGILTNPLIVSSLLGFVLLKLQVELPAVVMSPVEDIAGLATPLALFILGGLLLFPRWEKYQTPCNNADGKADCRSGGFVTLAALLGFRRGIGKPYGGVFRPGSVNSYTMAQQMGADSELAAQHGFFSSAFSIMTIFVLVFIGKQLALF